MKKLEPAI